jgi:hypothetical protein
MMVMQTAATALLSLVMLAVPRLAQLGDHGFRKFLVDPNFDEQERSADQLIESTIGREKKNQPWLHRIPPR